MLSSGVLLAVWFVWRFPWLLLPSIWHSRCSAQQLYRTVLTVDMSLMRNQPAVLGMKSTGEQPQLRQYGVLTCSSTEL